MGEKWSFKDAFSAFSTFGDTRSDGTTITLSQSDKWMKQAGIIDGKTLTTTDTGIAFSKFRKRCISVKEYEQFIEDLAKEKKRDPGELKEMLMSCGEPGLKGVTKVAKTDVVERLTDHTKYTGTHKERFDEEGKGKGIEGRADVADTSGYVSGYKGQGTYDEKQAEDEEK